MSHCKCEAVAFRSNDPLLSSLEPTEGEASKDR